MKIKLSKSQWQEIGKRAGWMKHDVVKTAKQQVVDMQYFDQYIRPNIKSHIQDEASHIYKTDHEMATVSYSVAYNYLGSTSGGYAFPSDDKGNVFEASLNPTALESLAGCKAGVGREFDPPKVQAHVLVETLCECGSGEVPWVEYDARGIPLTYVCGKCKEEKLSHYRPDVLKDPNYWHDEPIDEPD